MRGWGPCTFPRGKSLRGNCWGALGFEASLELLLLRLPSRWALAAVHTAGTVTVLCGRLPPKNISFVMQIPRLKETDADVVGLKVCGICILTKAQIINSRAIWRWEIYWSCHLEAVSRTAHMSQKPEHHLKPGIWWTRGLVYLMGHYRERPKNKPIRYHLKASFQPQNEIEIKFFK